MIALRKLFGSVARSDHSHATDRPGGNPPSHPPGQLIQRIGTALRNLIGWRPEPEPEHLVACSWPDCGRFAANPYRTIRHAVRPEQRRGA